MTRVRHEVDLSDYVILDIEGNIMRECLNQLYELASDIDYAVPGLRVTLEVQGMEVLLVFESRKEE